MAAVSRTPFAPLDGPRLKTLTSSKNKQNALFPCSTNSPGKRKAVELDYAHDVENIAPLSPTKRSKAKVDLMPPSPSPRGTSDLFRPSKAAAAAATTLSTMTTPPPLARKLANPMSSPIPKPGPREVDWSPMSAPAGRSPPRASSQRLGVLGSRRRGVARSPFARVEPPSFGLKTRTPFSLDAALKGTISGYSGRTAAAAPKLRRGAKKTAAAVSSPLAGSSADLYEIKVDASWEFEIHEDTPEQEMTNLLQHSTCVLDISSDEEAARRSGRDQAEGRDKENVPPAEHVGPARQSVAAARAQRCEDKMTEKSRGPLAEMDAADFYADGCDDFSVIIVPGDDEDDFGSTAASASASASATAAAVPFARSPLRNMPLLGDEEEEDEEEADDASPLKEKDTSLRNHQDDENEPEASSELQITDPAALELEDAGETFDLWESESAKDEGCADSPVPASPAASCGDE